MPMVPPEEPDVMYVSAVKGAIVTRYGTRNWIGCVRKDGILVWDEEKVVMIPAAEVIRFGREYKRALERKELRMRSKADFDAFVKGQRDREREHDEKQKQKQKPARAAGKE